MHARKLKKKALEIDVSVTSMVIEFRIQLPEPERRKRDLRTQSATCFCGVIFESVLMQVEFMSSQNSLSSNRYNDTNKQQSSCPPLTKSRMILSTSPSEENKTKQTGAYISESRGWRVTTINETQVRKLRGIDSRTNMLEVAEINACQIFAYKSTGSQKRQCSRILKSL